MMGGWVAIKFNPLKSISPWNILPNLSMPALILVLIRAGPSPD
jgi:hypothetical protein